MASTYSATLLQDAIYKASQKDMFQKFETRGSNYGALDAAIAQRGLLLPDSTLEKIRKASSQTEKINVFVKEANGTGTVRKCAGTGDGVTAQVPLVWATIEEEFQMSFLDMEQNQYDFDEMFQRRLEQRLLSMYSRLDAIQVAALEANYTAGVGTQFSKYNDASQVPLNDYDITTNRAALWLNKAKSDMFDNYLSMDNLMMVGESGLIQVQSSMQNQGSGNETNLGFQFNGVTFKNTNRIINNDGRYATGYLFEKGMFTMLTWVNALARKGKDIGTDVWTLFQDPRYKFDIELKVKKGCTDNSSKGAGMQADYAESYVLSMDYATPFAYASDGNSGVYKYEFDRDNSVQSGSGSYV